MTNDQTTQSARIRKAMVNLIITGATIEHISLATRVSEDRILAFLRGRSAPPARLGGLFMRAVANGGDHSILRRLDGMVAEGYSRADFFDASGGLLLPQHMRARSSSITRLGALCAVRTLSDRAPSRRPDFDLALEARSQGAVALFRWGRKGDIDAENAVPGPDECLRRRGAADCSCSPDCREARYRRAKRRRVLGDPPVPAEHSARHARWLMGVTGANVTHMSRAARMHPSSMADLVRGDQHRIGRSASDAVLAITPQDLWDAPGRVPAYRVFRRLDALRVAGWPISRVAEYAVSRGIENATWELHRRYRKWFEREMLDAVDEFYRAHVRHPGPSRSTAKRARSGLLIPWALWENIDDLSEVPDTSEIAFEDAAA